MASTRATAAKPDAEQEERSGLDIIGDYANAILALALLVAVAVFFMQWRMQETAQQEAKAWDAMRERTLEGTYFPIKPGIEELSHLTELYKGSSAEPFILLAYGNALYERGKLKDLEEARVVFEAADVQFSDHPVVGTLFRKSIESIASELKLLEELAKSDSTPTEPGGDSTDDAIIPGADTESD